MAALAGAKANGAKLVRTKAKKANKEKPNRRKERVRRVKPGIVIAVHGSSDLKFVAQSPAQRKDRCPTGRVVGVEPSLARSADPCWQSRVNLHLPIAAPIGSP